MSEEPTSGTRQKQGTPEVTKAAEREGTPETTKAAKREGTPLAKHASKALETMTTAGNTEGPRNSPTRREIGNTTEDETRPWQCVVCKLPATSPEQLTAHMMRNHWDDEWILRIENTPVGIRITMSYDNNQAQIQNMSATPNNTKRTMEVETEDTTETTAKEVEEVDTMGKTAGMHNTPNKKNHSTGSQTGKEKQPTTPTETLRETLERQRKTMDLIMNKNPAKNRRNNRKSH